jgi:hypothetical protein
MAQYQIYSARIPAFTDTGVVILTVFFNPGGYLIGEWFLLLPDEKGTVLATRLRFDVKSFNDDCPIQLDENFMLEQTFGQASASLLHYINDKRGKSFSGGMDPSALIRPGDLKLLVHLWVRGSCKNLVEVYRKTECDLLRDAVRPILDLPSISTGPL